MGEFLRRIQEAQGITTPQQKPITEYYQPPVPPTTDTERQNLQTELDKANVRLGELQEYAAFGGVTAADRRLMATQEEKISLLSGRLTASPLERNVNPQHRETQRVGSPITLVPKVSLPRSF
jgi:hypothetical protein